MRWEDTVLYGRRHTQPLFPEAATGETKRGAEGRGPQDGDGRQQQWNSNGEETKRASEEQQADSFRLGWEASEDRCHYPE